MRSFFQPVLGLHGISPMAMAIPPNPPVAMYGQYVVIDGKSYSEFHQWPSVDHWWKTPGYRWKLTIFEVIFWYVAHLDAEKNWEKITCNFAENFAITYSGKAITHQLHHFWRYRCRISFKRRSSLTRRKYFGIKVFSKSRFKESAMNVILLSSKSQFERTTSTQNFQ